MPGMLDMFGLQTSPGTDCYLSGESHSREHPNDNDSADGARLTAPQASQADAEAQQETLGTYAS